MTIRVCTSVALPWYRTESRGGSQIIPLDHVAELGLAGHFSLSFVLNKASDTLLNFYINVDDR